MRDETLLFSVNGRPLPVPDGEVAVTYTDVEAMNPVRDQDGFLHRCVLRSAVAAWDFYYQCLTEPERQWLESLFPATGEPFLFVHPDREDLHKPAASLCYREKCTVALRDSRGIWSDCRFRIREV